MGEEASRKMGLSSFQGQGRQARLFDIKDYVVREFGGRKGVLIGGWIVEKVVLLGVSKSSGGIHKNLLLSLLHQWRKENIFDWRRDY